jgi:hypothetical protein
MTSGYKLFIPQFSELNRLNRGIIITYRQLKKYWDLKNTDLSCFANTSPKHDISV